MLEEPDCCGCNCVLRVWSKEVGSREKKVWGEEISKCWGNSKSAVLLAGKQCMAFAAGLRSEVVCGHILSVCSWLV